MNFSNSFVSDTELVNKNQSYQREVKQDEIVLNKVHNLTNKKRKTKSKKENIKAETLDRIESFKQLIRNAENKYEDVKHIIEDKYDNKIDFLKQQLQDAINAKANQIQKALSEKDATVRYWTTQINNKIRNYNREAKHLQLDELFQENELVRTSTKVKTKKFKSLVEQEIQNLSESDSESESESDSQEDSSTTSSLESKNSVIYPKSAPEPKKEQWEIDYREYAKERDEKGVPPHPHEVCFKWPALYQHWKEEEKADDEERKKNPRKVELDEEELKYKAQLEEEERIKKARVKQFQVIENLLEEIKSERDSKFDKTEDNSKSKEYNDYCDRIKALNLRKAKGEANRKLEIF